MVALDDYRTLGRSGLRVSPLCLGAMTFGEDWGWGANAQDSRRMFDMYAGKLTTVITDPDHLEFTLHGADKASGLIDLTARLGIAQEEVLAFGDSNNDVTMLSWAGLGVAMSHGTTQARLAAKMISAPGDEGASLARAVDSILQSV